MAMDPSEAVAPALSQGWGYGVTLGFGFAFAIGMMGITHLLKKFNGEDNSKFEYYATAGRNVGTGLTATAVISSWGWSTALLSSSTVTYNYGQAGAYWFAAGCLVQICMFAVLAIQSKLKTPHAHTVLEVVRVRYGRTAHWVYMVLCLINNLIAVCNMLLGASAAIAALTGMDTIAATFLLPVGVCLYTISGGPKATFITDWLHTTAPLLIVAYLCVKTVTNDYLNEGGGLNRFYELIQEAGRTAPIAGNHNGSYLTMASISATDSYWQKAYSGDIAAAVPGYIIGGILYFGFVWALGTIAGLGGVALTSNPAWPAFGRMLNESELANGLVLPYTAQVVAGKGGAVAVVIVIFMAVTSTTSAQLVAVSSIISSDVYHTYIRPDAREQDVIICSRWACVTFAIFAAGFSTMLYEIGLSLTWTLYFLGIVVCPGGATLVWTVLWKKQTKEAAIIAPLAGMAGGLATWLAVANHRGNGVLNVTTTGDLLSCLYGTLVSAFLPVILSPLISFAFPREDFAWEKFSGIKLINDKAHQDGEEENEGETVIDGETEAITSQQRTFMQRQRTDADCGWHGCIPLPCHLDHLAIRNVRRKVRLLARILPRLDRRGHHLGLYRPDLRLLRAAHPRPTRLCPAHPRHLDGRHRPVDQQEARRSLGERRPEQDAHGLRLGERSCLLVRAGREADRLIGTALASQWDETRPGYPSLNQTTRRRPAQARSAEGPLPKKKKKHCDPWCTTRIMTVIDVVCSASQKMMRARRAHSSGRGWYVIAES